MWRTLAKRPVIQDKPQNHWQLASSSTKYLAQVLFCLFLRSAVARTWQGPLSSLISLQFALEKNKICFDERSFSLWAGCSDSTSETFQLLSKQPPTDCTDSTGLSSSSSVCFAALKNSGKVNWLLWLPLCWVDSCFLGPDRPGEIGHLELNGFRLGRKWAQGLIKTMATSPSAGYFEAGLWRSVNDCSITGSPGEMALCKEMEPIQRERPLDALPLCPQVLIIHSTVLSRLLILPSNPDSNAKQLIVHGPFWNKLKFTFESRLIRFVTAKHNVKSSSRAIHSEAFGISCTGESNDWLTLRMLLLIQ